MTILLPLFLFMACSAPREIVVNGSLAPRCQCEGSGDITLVMDAGLGNWSLFYRPLMNQLVEDYRVCAIDRPGYAMEAVTTKSRDLKTVARELDGVLVEQGIAEDFVLLGHSLGGLHVRQYQSIFPDKVQGLVLLDTPHSEQFDRLPQEFHDMLKAQPAQLDDLIELAEKGYLKYGKKKIPTFGLSDALLDEYYEVVTRPEYYYTTKKEVESFEGNLAQSRQLSSLADLPLLVIGSQNSMDEVTLAAASEDYPFEAHNKTWYELQKELAALSTQSTFVGSQADHYLIVTDVDLVNRSVRQWIENHFSDEQ